MTVYEVLETYCKNCAHIGNCWKPCPAAISAVMTDEKVLLCAKLLSDTALRMRERIYH